MRGFTFQIFFLREKKIRLSTMNMTVYFFQKKKYKNLEKKHPRKSVKLAWFFTPSGKNPAH